MRPGENLLLLLHAARETASAALVSASTLLPQSREGPAPSACRRARRPPRAAPAPDLRRAAADVAPVRHARAPCKCTSNVRPQHAARARTPACPPPTLSSCCARCLRQGRPQPLSVHVGRRALCWRARAPRLLRHARARTPPRPWLGLWPLLCPNRPPPNRPTPPPPPRPTPPQECARAVSSVELHSVVWCKGAGGAATAAGRRGCRTQLPPGAPASRFWSFITWGGGRWGVRCAWGAWLSWLSTGCPQPVRREAAARPAAGRPSRPLPPSAPRATRLLLPRGALLLQPLDLPVHAPHLPPDVVQALGHVGLGLRQVLGARGGGGGAELGGGAGGEGRGGERRGRGGGQAGGGGGAVARARGGGGGLEPRAHLLDERGADELEHVGAVVKARQLLRAARRGAAGSRALQAARARPGTPRGPGAGGRVRARRVRPCACSRAPP